MQCAVFFIVFCWKVHKKRRERLSKLDLVYSALTCTWCLLERWRLIKHVKCSRPVRAKEVPFSADQVYNDWLTRLVPRFQSLVIIYRARQLLPRLSYHGCRPVGCVFPRFCLVSCSYNKPVNTGLNTVNSLKAGTTARQTPTQGRHGCFDISDWISLFFLNHPAHNAINRLTGKIAS